VERAHEQREKHTQPTPGLLHRFVAAVNR
jgi:hypothetical protein